MINITVINQNQAGYQRRVGRIPDKPKQLFIRGVHDFNKPSIAVIGSRNQTPYGLDCTKKIVASLVRAGVHIISGLALGTDGSAHRTAVEAGGTTTAIMPAGLENIYPASHRGLAEQIISSNGALISEHPVGSTLHKGNFVARNRIVAGLSDAVLVIEAAAKSGTLITAEFALDMGIPVLAVPGPINSTYSAGTNRLIQIGAGLVSSYEDVLNEIGLDVKSIKETPLAYDKVDMPIISALSGGAISAQELSTQTKLPAQDLSRRLTHLELSGIIHCLGNNQWTLK